MKRSFLQAAVVSILIYGCTTWTLTKRMEKKLDGNYTRILRAILNKSWRQHPTKQQLYGHLPPISKTIKIRRTRHAGHCWRSRDELISDVLLWTPSHGRPKAGRPTRTYIQELCVDKECSAEDLPEAMDGRKGWRERVRDICADSVTWWWWWWSPKAAIPWLWPQFIHLLLALVCWITTLLFHYFVHQWFTKIIIYIYIYIYIYIGKNQLISILKKAREAIIFLPVF